MRWSQYISIHITVWILVTDSAARRAAGWTVRGSNTGGSEIFRTCPDRPWGPPSLLYNGYRVFPGSNERPGRGAEPSPISCTGTEALYRGALYLFFYSSATDCTTAVEKLQMSGCPIHAMKAYWRSRGIAPFILNIGAVVNFTVRSLYPRGWAPVPVGWASQQIWTFRTRKKYFLLPKFEPRTAQHVRDVTYW